VENANLSTVRIRVEYDLASTLCYVAKRCMERLGPDLEAAGVELDWSPIDLSMLTRWPRDVEPSDTRRANVLRVAEELSVPVQVPRLWHDSRRAHAIGLAAAALRRPTWRERVMSAVYEEGRPLSRETVDQLAAELGLRTAEDELAAGLEELEARTRKALEQGVTGVPTFMLSRWPFGGIQNDDTMRTVLTRFAARQRERAGADAATGEVA
jgi:predicted DsbA family dithiol-disulfide isomerase